MTYCKSKNFLDGIFKREITVRKLFYIDKFHDLKYV